MTQHTVKYVVSDAPDRISTPVPPGEPDVPRDPVLYAFPDTAISAIKNGEYGEYGTRYVLRVELSVAVTAERGWTMFRHDPELSRD